MTCTIYILTPSRIIKKLEIHYTPKHESWLDIAEIELNVITHQCLPRQIESIDVFHSELSARENERNNCKSKVNWQFTTNNFNFLCKKVQSLFSTS